MRRLAFLTACLLTLAGTTGPGVAQAGGRHGGHGYGGYGYGGWGGQGRTYHGPRAYYRGGPRVYVGGGPAYGWGPTWAWVAPIVRGAPTVVIQPVPQVYIQQGAPAAYWYYCPGAGQYYPDVPTCAESWVLVPPLAD